DSGNGLEVFMVERNASTAFAPGVHVFPGGAVDAADHEMARFCPGLDDAGASRTLGLASGGLAYWVSAIRECFEESGVLLATGADGGLLELDAPTNRPHYHEARKQLNAGEVRFSEICQRFDLRLAVDQLVYYSHWQTPIGSERRY